ncbi:MAG TPA: hypothetical protein VGF17_27535 [Phytomonospora sp.]
MSVVCHVWPGITPFNIWDLTWRDWVRFARDADAWVAARSQTTEGGGSGG